MIYVCMCMFVCMYVCKYVCTYMCICMNAYVCMYSNSRAKGVLVLYWTLRASQNLINLTKYIHMHTYTHTRIPTCIVHSYIHTYIHPLVHNPMALVLHLYIYLTINLHSISNSFSPDVLTVSDSDSQRGRKYADVMALEAHRK